MNGEEAINLLREMRADNLNLDDVYTKDKYEALGMAIEAIEQIECLTDRPCNVCRFKTENGCYHWECVFKGV